MPLKDILCKSCGYLWEEILNSWDDAPNCVQCDSPKTEKLVSSHGGYGIKGDNSASVRPRGAGSPKRSK